MKKPTKPIYLPPNGQELKMPRSKQELFELLQVTSSTARRQAEDHVLYLQGRPTRSLHYTTAAKEPSSRPTLAELRVDISMTIQRVAESNAQIAVSLARILDGLK